MFNAWSSCEHKASVTSCVCLSMSTLLCVSFEKFILNLNEIVNNLVIFIDVVLCSDTLFEPPYLIVGKRGR